MADFPRLKTGAVMQYPARKTRSFSTQVLRFLDGAEQRYRDSAGLLRSWAIDLTQLDETEVAALDLFFRSSQGETGSFTFHDPLEDVDYTDCSLAGGELSVRFLEAASSAAVLIVRQNRS